MIAMPYHPASAVVGTVERRAKKEVMPVMRENGPSPDRSRLLAALRVLLAALHVLLFVALVGLVGMYAAVGPGITLGWVVDNLIPVVVAGGAIFVVFGLAALGLARLYDKHRHHP